MSHLPYSDEDPMYQPGEVQVTASTDLGPSWLKFVDGHAEARESE
jgi:hypothetical protein